MNNLTTRKIVLGVLMTLMLAFGMQSVVQAVTVTIDTNIPDSPTGSSTVEIQAGQSFEVTFAVTLNSRDRIQHPRGGYADQAVTSTSILNDNRVDSSGYEAHRIGSTDYRTLNTAGTAYISSNKPGDYDIQRKRGSLYEAPADNTRLSRSDKEVYDTDGHQLYYYNSITKDADVIEILEHHWVKKSDSEIYYYDEESIKIEPSSGLTLKLKSNGISITSSSKLTERLTGSTSSVDDLTNKANTGSASVTLICTAAAIGAKAIESITVWNSTDDSDYPPNALGRVPNGMEDEIGKLAVLVREAPTLDDRTLPTARKIEKIDELFANLFGTELSSDGQKTIVYEVIKGSGTLYSATAPTLDTIVLAHQANAVYLNMKSTTNEVAAYIQGSIGTKEIIEFRYIGTDRGNTADTGQPPPQQQARLLISVSGETVTVNALTAAGVSDPGILVTLSSTDFALSQAVTTGTPTPITLPSTAGSYSLFARHPTNAYAPGTATVTVAGPALGTLTISPSGTPVNGVQNISITARTADTTIPPGALSVTLSGTGFTPTIATVLRGSVIHPIVLPTVAGTYTLTARATGYDDSPTRIVVGGATTTPTTTPTLTPTPTPTVVAEPSSIQISGPAARSGTVNAALDAPLLVQVLDANRTGVADARVIFRVISGRGRLSERGNGRAVGVQTDSSGYARANFTPTDDGTITVRASATGVTAAVTFTISTGSVAPTGTPGTTTPRTTTSRAPVVHVTAASRPPMLWVDGGAIYALVGASPQRFAASVDNALNITVGGGKVYWTEKTGESGGTINSANLNGSDVTELTSILAVPMGIAVDTAGSKLYWTNSRGRIQSADLDGSGITNVMQNLPSPMDLALAGGNAYWTQGNGSVRFVNLRGQKVVRNVSTGTDTPGSLVIGGGKVYWTEMTGESGGTVNSANLNGTGATPLASILAAPMGIAVDGSRSKLYWTNSRGRVQSANLDGSGIKNVVSGLGSPSELVLSNSISAPTATPTTTRSTTTASNKYDVNGDGSVNNADSDAITVAIAAGATDAKYDVNGDGTVNVFDLVEIIANRDPGAAGAPTLFGMKMSAVQIDFIQEQIDLLIATNDRSPAAMRTLIYLQQLLVTARPEKTQLLANYPNPFNPETWIPYELATDTDVRLTIYNTQGVVIRTLQLGHQSAGYYTGRDRAAYWDGRNSVGEQVASGLYFYQLETDEMSLMRKMVILK